MQPKTSVEAFLQELLQTYTYLRIPGVVDEVQERRFKQLDNWQWPLDAHQRYFGEDDHALSNGIYCHFVGGKVRQVVKEFWLGVGW